MLARDNENFRTLARIELTTLRILHVYWTFQPLYRRVASSIFARGMEIFFVPGEHGFSSFQVENVHCVLLTSVSLKLSFRSPAEKKKNRNKQTLFGNYLNAIN